MARPSIPESEKRRTVPLRMTKPDYRKLMFLMQATDLTIQEHLRNAVNEYLDRLTKDIAGQVTFRVPSSYEMASMSDQAFQQWLESTRNRDDTRPAKRGGLRVQQAAA